MSQADVLAKIYERIPRIIRKSIIEPAVYLLPVNHNNLSLDFKLKRFISGFDIPSRFRHHVWQASFITEQQNNLFSDYVKPQIVADAIFDDLNRYISEADTGNFDSQRDYLFFRTYLMDNILVKVDRASMQHALEVRAPFLDRDVVDLVNTFPKKFKQKGLNTKYILKKTMVGKLPTDIINRPKKGFGIPLALWLNNDLKNFCNEILSENRIKSSNLFNWDYIEKLKNDHFSLKSNNYKQIWSLMVFQMWLEKWGK